MEESWKKSLVCRYSVRVLKGRDTLQVLLPYNTVPFIAVETIFMNEKSEITVVVHRRIALLCRYSWLKHFRRSLPRYSCGTLLFKRMRKKLDALLKGKEVYYRVGSSWRTTWMYTLKKPCLKFRLRSNPMDGSFFVMTLAVTMWPCFAIRLLIVIVKRRPIPFRRWVLYTNNWPIPPQWLYRTQPGTKHKLQLKSELKLANHLSEFVPVPGLFRPIGEGKLRNPKLWIWRHLAAATRTDGPTAWRGSAVRAAATRWRQNEGLGFHSFRTLS